MNKALNVVLIVYKSHICMIKHLDFFDAVYEYDYYTDNGYHARICSDSEAKQILDKDIQLLKKIEN